MAHDSGHEVALPKTRIDQLLAPLVRFLHIEAASGIVLLVATAIALGLANSPWSDAYIGFWNTELGVRFGEHTYHHTLMEWINDGLMVIFFFVVGMEVKRELVVGALREFRTAALPMIAAIGGMIVPAGLYLLVERGQAASSGWGIPMATDIAFVVGCMAVLGRRVPNGLRVTMLTLAIADDIGAILVIAFGYSHGLSWFWLGMAAAGLVGVWLMKVLGVRSFLAYVVGGVIVWVLISKSGVHATIAGVILGLMTPARPLADVKPIAGILERIRGSMSGDLWQDDKARAQKVLMVQDATAQAVSPLEYLVQVLHPWVGFVIMPLFALANAGVVFSAGHLFSLVSVAVILGLFVGKPVGVLLASYIAVKAKVARLPDEVTWTHMLGGGILAGIGFTMALFIADLALGPETLDMAKVGVLAGSCISAIAGCTVLLMVKKARPAQ